MFKVLTWATQRYVDVALCPWAEGYDVAHEGTRDYRYGKAVLSPYGTLDIVLPYKSRQGEEPDIRISTSESPLPQFRGRCAIGAIFCVRAATRPCDRLQHGKELPDGIYEQQRSIARHK